MEFRWGSYRSFWKDSGGILGCFFCGFSSVCLCCVCFNSFWFALQNLVFSLLSEAFKPPQYTNRQTNKQETHGILYRNLFRIFVRNAMLKKLTTCNVCYAHTIHQTNDKQSSKKQTIWTCKQSKNTQEQNQPTNKQARHTWRFAS